MNELPNPRASTFFSSPGLPLSDPIADLFLSADLKDFLNPNASPHTHTPNAESFL